MTIDFPGNYPATRLRRTRRTEWMRKLVRETRLFSDDLIWPLFVREGKGEQEAVASMPGVYRYSIDFLVKKAKRAQEAGIPAIALFPVVPADKKSEDGAEAFLNDNLIARAVQEVKASVPDIGIICDVALDPYTTHGQDGLVVNGEVANDATVEALCRQSLALAKAGADIVAPSDMMDGRVGAIRQALDAEGHEQVAILSYAAKYASAFYGPFRDAVGSATNLKGAGKASYQMDPANSAEALREVAMDIREGADIVMVKPGMPYLDIIRDVAATFPVPVFAYQVSGEYAMLKAAEEKGWLTYERVLAESLLALKRAGASAIVTYAALEVAESMRE